MSADASALRTVIAQGAEQVVAAASEALGRDIDATSAPIDEGELVGSRRTDASGTTATISYEAEHASYQDEGTGPHEIAGNPFLSFDVGGAHVVVRSVQHPGSTKNKGWFTDRVGEWPEFVQREIEAGGLGG